MIFRKILAKKIGKKFAVKKICLTFALAIRK